MEIKQDLETGQIKYYLEAGEVYDTDKHLTALSEEEFLQKEFINLVFSEFLVRL